MLSETELLASDVVANATMNRGRGLSGVNSYERELRFDIAGFLQSRVEAQGRAVWYDVCCGEGRALVELAKQFAVTNWGRKVQIVGADLVGMFVGDVPPEVGLVVGDAMDLTLETPADLITCVHGLHYLGDKLGFLQKMSAMLAPDGLFLGHLDAANLRLPVPWPQTLRQAVTEGCAIRFRNRILRITHTGAPLCFPLNYRGATISETPNYTGIIVVDSWYGPP